MKFFSRTKYFFQNNSYSISMATIISLTMFLSVFSFLYYYSHGQTMSLIDSKAHLNIARRLLFSLTPGLTQLGGVWLPLPHILDFLTIWNNFMYYTGLSGSIISMISFILSVVIIYKIVYIYTKSLFCGMIGSLIMMLNPSFLYLQSSPMTELVSIFTSLLAIYFIIKWSINDKVDILIIAALLTSISTLTRYDNWFLVPPSIIVIGFIALLRYKKWKFAESNMVLFSVLAFFGIFIWLLYNQLIFGNMLNFAYSSGSGTAAANGGGSVSRHNIINSILIYYWTTVDTIGIIPTFMIIIGSIVFAFKNKLNLKSLPVYLLLMPILFNITSLYLGQSIIDSQHVYPYILYNSRYGINALEAAAFFIAIFSYYFRKLSIILIIILIIQYGLLFYQSPPSLLESIRLNNNLDRTTVVKYLLSNPVKGDILEDDLIFNTVTFDARIPQENVIYQGSGKYYREALKSPQKYVNVILMQNGDLIWKRLHNSNLINEYYETIKISNSLKIYVRKA